MDLPMSSVLIPSVRRLYVKLPFPTPQKAKRNKITNYGRREINRDTSSELFCACCKRSSLQKTCFVNLSVVRLHDLPIWFVYKKVCVCVYPRPNRIIVCQKIVWSFLIILTNPNTKSEHFNFKVPLLVSRTRSVSVTRNVSISVIYAFVYMIL